MASPFNQQGDHQIDSLGYYYVITGGKFPNGQTVNGKKSSGGSMAFILDDPAWQSWGYNYALDTWHKDGWFEQTAGLALTMKHQGGIVYDNFNNDAGTFYQTPPGQTSASTPGLYRGYSMSNNYDWIYAGYFKLDEATTIDTIMGYFDPTEGFNPDASNIKYRMNIWANVDVDVNGAIWKYPDVASFTGSVLSSDYVSGSFTWGDSGWDRVFGEDYGYKTDDIWYLSFCLGQSITLPAGEYWFSHEATIVPLPGAVWLLGSGLIGLIGLRRKLAG
ncbi:MAG: VPLPA-CTERM sorting domain-containing protein [Thermodesulfobacteriota bacterium]